MNLASKKITKEYICDLLMQSIIQESLDKDIRNQILDKFENEPYYEFLIDVYDEISLAYFKLGFEFHSLITS